MKKILLSTILLVVSHCVWATEPYSGIWTGEEEYYTVHQNGESMILIVHSPGKDWWEAWIGGKSDEKWVLNLWDQRWKGTVELTFESDTKATKVLTSCEPTGWCEGPVGWTEALTKFF